MDAINLTLRGMQQGHAALTAAWQTVKAALAAGHVVRVDIATKKSRDQECLYHSCFGDLARDCPMHGQKVDAEVWKRALLQAFYSETRDDPEFSRDWKGRAPRVIPTLDGLGMLVIGVESKHLTTKLASAFITFVHATGDERGVRWSRTSLGRDEYEGEHA